MDPDSPLVKFEINEIEEVSRDAMSTRSAVAHALSLQNISLTGADKRWWDFRRLFQTRCVARSAERNTKLIT